jgi:hypothetical protein
MILTSVAPAPLSRRATPRLLNVRLRGGGFPLPEARRGLGVHVAPCFGAWLVTG